MNPGNGPRYPFYQLDVFTREPLTGNALAVFPEAEGIDDATMQRLAREMNLSETTFVLPSGVARRRVRIFTPTAELPLAGHPTIGTWWLLAELGAVALPENGVVTIKQETGAGVLPVHIHAVHGKPDRVVMVQAKPVFATVINEIAPLAAALGGPSESIAATPPPQVVSTAVPQLMVPIRALDDLVRLPVGGMGGELARFLENVGTHCAMCYTIVASDPAFVVRCRMFAPGLGVPEDPATGSAAGALGAYLVRNGVIAPIDGTARLRILQGAEIHRPSEIHVEVDATDADRISEVRVGGAAVTVMRGEVML